MDNLFKKKLVACLLAVACIICILLLATEKENARSVSPAKADSLLLQELSAFNIPADKIRWSRVDVDSSFYRINYRIKLPSGVSKTWVHSELSRKLHDINMTTWGKVSFPEKHLKIHVLSDNTILRSISMVTDTSYYRRMYPAVAMMYFDRPPSENLIKRIKTFGEPISLVLRVRTAAQAESWAQLLDDSHFDYYFWMTDDDHIPGGEFNENRFLQRSRSIADVSSRPGLLFFQPATSPPGPAFFESLAQRNISLIGTQDASIISSNNGRFEFSQAFRSFSQKARQGQNPVALIQATEQSIEWFADGLNELKKGGIVLTRPEMVDGAD